MAQEIHTTFEDEVDELSLVPGSGGIFEVIANGQVIWSRKKEGRFPDVTELKQIQGPADNLNVKVGIKDNEYFSVVNEDDYWVMTKNEEQNDKLIKANNLIQAIDMVSKYRKVYPADICRGTSGFLNFDFRRQKYYLNLT